MHFLNKPICKIYIRPSKGFQRLKSFILRELDKNEKKDDEKNKDDNARYHLARICKLY